MDTITTAPSTSEAIVEEPVLEILTSMGAIKVKLYKETPLHRDNFVKLARNGYFNGILFHRVINGFMIQTGDPLTRDTTKMDLWGNGGPNYTIPAEFVDTLKHKKGAIAAARRGDSVNPQKESSGSQFYIVQSETGCAHLDGSYTVFGETIDGFSVIDNIAGVETNIKDRPLYPISIISIKEVK
ncbi:MAG: peptidylprolyl isomerase [Bacteroidales bacterium]|nr:peptidylprolyl isomerase [Bacteroidales bacterium]